MTLTENETDSTLFPLRRSLSEAAMTWTVAAPPALTMVAVQLCPDASATVAEFT